MLVRSLSSGGTDVIVGTCKEKFRRFVRKFIDPNMNPNEDENGVNPDEPLCLQRLEEVSIWPFYQKII
jgi:DNA replication licensing factor MCM4